MAAKTTTAVATLVVATAAVVGVLSGFAVPKIQALTAAASAGPPVPSDAQATPLALPVAPPAGEGGFAAMMKQPDGSPVGWDPCRPTHYVINPAGAPTGGQQIVQVALERVSKITGQQFVFDGPTEEVPNEDRPAVLKKLYGNRWAPVLISWSDPSKSPGLSGSVAGYAGPMAIRSPRTNELRYISGQVVLDAPQMQRILSEPAGLSRGRAVVMHELGHLMGLEHVKDSSLLMNPSTSAFVTDFADGDLRGLAAVSGQECYNDE